MCTAVSFLRGEHYFGRTLDIERSYGEEIIISPRNFPFHFGEAGEMNSHYAIIGMAHVERGYPLYYDAVNEQGLAMAKKSGEPWGAAAAAAELLPPGRLCL